MYNCHNDSDTSLHSANDLITKLFPPQAFHSAHDAQLLMDSVPPDKRVPGGQYSGGSSQAPSRPDSSASDVSFSSLMQPPPKSSDTCEVRIV